MSFSDWNLNKKDRIYLIFLAVFTLITTIKLMEFHMSGGMYNPDKCVYLISAYKYAGMDYYNICDVNDLYFTPVISGLTALLLMMGINGQFAISFVTAIFGIFAYFGLYFLFRYRFDQILSLTGTILFGSCTIVLLNFASGMIDIPGISISIWMLFFGLLAVDKNPKYFYLVFPLFVIGFFTRYTSAFTLPVILLYYLIKRDVINVLDNLISDRTAFKNMMSSYFKSSEFKYLVTSIILSFVLFIIICKFTLFDYGASLTFLEQSHNTLNISVTNPDGVNYNLHKAFYLDHFTHEFLFGFYRDFNFSLTFLIFAILFGGFSLKIINMIKNISFLDYLKKYKKEYKTRYLEKLLIVILVISLILSFVEFKVSLNHLTSNLFLLISFICFFSLISQYKINKEIQSINLIMFSWFAVYLIFISIYPIKTYRYAVPLLPPFIYFVIYGLESILHTISFGFDNFETLKSKCENFSENEEIYFKRCKIIPLILIIILLISTFSYIAPWKIEESPVEALEHINHKGFINDLVNITEYIKETDPDYRSKDIASYYHHYRMIKLYLQTNVSFINDDYHEIDLSNSDYVILNEKVKFDNYHEIYNCGDFYLYYRNGLNESYS